MNVKMNDIDDVSCILCVVIDYCTAAGFTYVPSSAASSEGCYTVVSQNMDWTAAGRECQQLHEDAHLVVISDDQEQNAIINFFADIDGSCLRVFMCHNSSNEHSYSPCKQEHTKKTNTRTHTRQYTQTYKK